MRGLARASWLAGASLGALLTAGLASGCHNSKSPSEPAPTPTPVPTVTETFSGSFAQSGAAAHNFTVGATGNVTIKLTSVAPLSTLQVGVGIGTVDSSLTPPCALFAQDNDVRLNDTFLSSSVAAGDYCVKVFDVGNVFPGVTVQYDVAVTHP